jgi:regulator of protease activity HflC (stomatin/prohibitin superfamily)
MAARMFPILMLVLTGALYYMNSPFYIFTGFVFLVLVTGIRVIYQYEEALKFRLGKFVKMHGP